MHSTSKECNGTVPLLFITIWKVKYPLCFFVSCVQPVTQQYKSRTVSVIKVGYYKKYEQFS